MRYQNWDILLFPHQSRVPIQEFDTKCHVLHHPKALPSTAQSASDDPFVQKFEFMTKVPILTCFVPSLAPGTPFRISIHSWLKPTASTILRASMAIEEETTFEARVYVDGIHHCSRTFHSDTTWPEVIETTGRLNLPLRRSESDLTELPHLQKNNDLRFPPFHPEILQQAHWDAGEQLGRVKIVISEGVMMDSGPFGPQKHAFDRLRDVVAFSFQHAPLNILEYSGIAWPNLRMFETIQRDPRRPGPIGTRLAGNKGHEAHAHSPHRSTSAHLGRSVSSIEQADAVAYQVYQPRSHLPSIGRLPAPPTGFGSGAVFSKDEDPFMGPSSASHQWRSKGRSNSTDDTMPDYDPDEAIRSRTTTEMSGISWPRRDFERHMDEAAVDEIVQALSPEKKSELVKALSPNSSSSNGLQPPTNTPKTGEASKQPSPVLKGSKNVPESFGRGLDRLVRQSRSLSDDSSVNPSSEDRPSRNSGSDRSGSRISDRLIVTRSQISKVPNKAQKIEDRHASDRERPDSVSSKRRKISLSPSTNTKATPKIALRVSPSSASSDKENQQLTEDEHAPSGVAITIE